MVLSTEGQYSGELQIKLLESGLKEKVQLFISPNDQLDAEQCTQLCLKHYDDLNDSVVKEKVLLFETLIVPSEKMERSRASGKLLRVIEGRVRK